jgi:flagellar motor switch protein FliN/FliY
MSDTAQAVEEQTQQQAEPRQDERTQVKSVEFTQAPEDSFKGSGSSIDILLDMEVPVSVVLGRVSIPVQRFLQLGPGSVLNLEKPIEAPAELYLKDSKFALGSIVVVDDKFAIKITEVIGASAPVPAAKK